MLLRTRRMFGGVGCYGLGVFFAIIANGRLYFRVSDKTRTQYEKAGSGPFRPTPKQTLKNYYEVPGAVQRSDRKLEAWARAAIASADDATR